MQRRPRNTLLERQLRAEVRQILQLLERARRTRQRARLLVALETGATRRVRRYRSNNVPK
jgi:hypothetical protein